MPTEDDVPLQGEAARRHYEQQFGDRIRKVNKGGAPPPPSNGGGGGGWNGRVGCGVVAVAAFVIRALVALIGRESHTPTYNFSPPKPFVMPQPKVWDERPHGAPDRRPDDVDEMLRQLEEQRKAAFGGPGDANLLAGDPDLTEEDVPLPQGLCYRIEEEASARDEDTPGKRIFERVGPAARRLIVRSARGEQLRPEERAELFGAFNKMLHAKDFYDGRSFERVPGVATLMLRGGLPNNPGRGSPAFNRLLLERCYPRQIVPFHERDLPGPDRDERRRRAQADLEQARREFEPAKR